MLNNSGRVGSSTNGSVGGVATAAGIVSFPSPQFAALCAQLDPPDGLLLGSRDLESQVVRTDHSEAATTAKRHYRVVSLAPLPRLTVAGAASTARSAADVIGSDAVIGWYRRRIGDSLRPEQQPQLAQLSAKEAHIHRRLCDEFAMPDLLLVLVQHARDPVTQALVTDTTVIRMHSHLDGKSSSSSMEGLPLEVLPVCRTHLSAQRVGGVGGSADGSCDTVRALRSADRLRCGQLAVELAAVADAGFIESQTALEALAKSLAKPPRTAGCGDNRKADGDSMKLNLQLSDSPTF